jgi:hypothetical protein
LASKGLGGIANLMQTGFTSAQARIQARSASPARSAMVQQAENYELQVGQLQQALLAAFETSGAAIGQMQAHILSDWGRLGRVYEMIRTPVGTSSLYWSTEMGALQAQQLLKSYTIQLLQTLMPLAKNSYTLSANVLHGPPTLKADQLGLQPDGATYVWQTRDGRQNTYLANGSADVLSIVWDNVGQSYNFFNGLSGWLIPVTYTNNGYSSTQAGLVVNIFNRTPQPMLIYTYTGDSFNVLGQIIIIYIVRYNHLEAKSL